MEESDVRLKVRGQAPIPVAFCWGYPSQHTFQAGSVCVHVLAFAFWVILICSSPDSSLLSLMKGLLLKDRIYLLLSGF